MCYRIYVETEIVATVFSLPHVATLINTWTQAGYTDVTFKKEPY